LATGLRDKAFSAVLWSFIDRVGQYGIQGLVSIVLARLLMPSEVGLISMLWIVILASQHIIDGGFSQALLQRPGATVVDESSVFYFNAVIACLAVGGVWVAAPYIADFYGIPALVSLARASALSLPIAALGLIQVTSLTKRLNLRTQAKAGFVATVLSGVIGIGMAYWGFGAWSLVAQSLSQNAFRVAGLWYLNPWRPVLVFRLDSLRELFPVGSRVLASSLIAAIFGNLYPVVIGRVFSSRDLGYYVIASRIPSLIGHSLSTVVSRVTLPVYPNLRHDPARYKAAIRKALTMIAAVNTPVMVGMSVLAEPMIRVVLTPKWLAAVPYLRLQSLVMAVIPLQTANFEAILSLDESKVWFRLQLVRKALSVANVAIAYRWGIQALILGELFTSLVGLSLGALYLGRSPGYSPWQQVRDLLPYGLLSAIMGGAAVLGARSVETGGALAELALGTAVGFACYVAMGVLFRLSAVRELADLALHGWRSLFGGRRAKDVKPAVTGDPGAPFA
jgi:O-antigen/teichoic acid export membrane protein